MFHGIYLQNPVVSAEEINSVENSRLTDSTNRASRPISFGRESAGTAVLAVSIIITTLFLSEIH